MKFGNLKCKDVECCKCPFGGSNIKVCSSFKLNEELFKGLKAAKKYMSQTIYNKAVEKLNREIDK